MPKQKLELTRFALLIDSIFTKNVLIDNVSPDVMMMTVPLSTLPEMADV